MLLKPCRYSFCEFQDCIFKGPAMQKLSLCGILLCCCGLSLSQNMGEMQRLNTCCNHGPTGAPLNPDRHDICKETLTPMF